MDNNIYLLKDVIQQQKDFKIQLNQQADNLNSMLGKVILEQQEKINNLQKELNFIKNILISKNIL